MKTDKVIVLSAIKSKELPEIQQEYYTYNYHCGNLFNKALI